MILTGLVAGEPTPLGVKAAPHPVVGETAAALGQFTEGETTIREDERLTLGNNRRDGLMDPCEV